MDFQKAQHIRVAIMKLKKTMITSLYNTPLYPDTVVLLLFLHFLYMVQAQAWVCVSHLCVGGSCVWSRASQPLTFRVT